LALQQHAWVPQGNPTVATSTNLSFSDDLAANVQRFYQVVQLN